MLFVSFRFPSVFSLLHFKLHEDRACPSFPVCPQVLGVFPQPGLPGGGWAWGELPNLPLSPPARSAPHQARCWLFREGGRGDPAPPESSRQKQPSILQRGPDPTPAGACPGTPSSAGGLRGCGSTSPHLWVQRHPSRPLVKRRPNLGFSLIRNAMGTDQDQNWDRVSTGVPWGPMSLPVFGAGG